MWQRQGAQSREPAIRAWGAGGRGLLGMTAVLAGATTVLAACGTAKEPGTAGPSTSGHSSSHTTAHGVPAGSPAAATAFANRMLSRLSLPSGAHATTVRTLPVALQHPEIGILTADRVDVHKLYTLTSSVSATGKYLTSHTPAATQATGGGESAVPANGSQAAGSVTASDWEFLASSVPAGIDTGALTVSVVPAHGGSLLRADAVVTWFPPRTAAEHLDLASIRSLELSVMLLNPRPHTVRQTISSHAVISRLVTLVNSFPAAPPMLMSCPAMFGSYRLSLMAPGPGGRPTAAVTVTPGGCGADGVWAGGKDQPALWDPHEQLISLVDHTLGITSGGGVMRPLPASPPGK